MEFFPSQVKSSMLNAQEITWKAAHKAKTQTGEKNTPKGFCYKGTNLLKQQNSPIHI